MSISMDQPFPLCCVMLWLECIFLSGVHRLSSASLQERWRVVSYMQWRIRTLENQKYLHNRHSYGPKWYFIMHITDLENQDTLIIRTLMSGSTVYINYTSSAVLLIHLVDPIRQNSYLNVLYTILLWIIIAQCLDMYCTHVCMHSLKTNVKTLFVYYSHSLLKMIYAII